MADEDQVVPESPLGASMMDQIRAQHKKLADSQDTIISVPGYEELLAVKYRVLDVQREINDINRRTSREFSDPIVAALYSTLDAMARACVEIFAVRGDDNVPLSEAFGPDTPPIRYDQKLAEFMDFKDVETAREVILRLFAENEPMIMDHGIRLNRWMTNTSRQVNDSFAGNL